MANLRKYHRIWLAGHPTRTEEWLKARMADGFHIHHMDGNRKNHDPCNLVLIEEGDHARLHQGAPRYLDKHKRASGPRLETLARGKFAYEQFASRPSATVFTRFIDDLGQECGYTHARVYAKQFTLTWPPVKSDRRERALVAYARERMLRLHD